MARGDTATIKGGVLVSRQRRPDQNVVPASLAEASDQGQAAAARKNRENQTRQQIVRALESLGSAFRTEWPGFVREFCRDPLEQTIFTDCALPPPFQPPEFDRLNQTPEEWAKAASAAWDQSRERFLQSCHDWVVTGVDEQIPATRTVRGPGSKPKSERGKNTVLERRYLWAAKYLLQVPRKEIAAQDNANVTTVGRVARETLLQANWLELAKAEKRASRR